MSKTSNKNSVCAICQKEIIDRSDGCAGEDSIFCEGACQRWLHRSCAGLPDPAFDLIHDSDEPFYCFPCSMASHAAEIKELRALVASLSNELADLKSIISPSNLAPANSRPMYSEVTQSRVSTGEGTTSPHSIPSVPMVDNPALIPPRHPPRVTASERKFNIIVFGVPECPKGTSRLERVSQDEAAITQSIQLQVPSFRSLSIRDCLRIGKYSESSDRPRPILVTLNKVADVNLILSKQFSLSTPNGFRVRADLSPTQRHTERLLLKERRLLIDQGSDRSSLKLRRNSLLVGDRLHCRVIGGVLVHGTSLADHAPELNQLSDQHPLHSPQHVPPSPSPCSTPSAQANVA